MAALLYLFLHPISRLIHLKWGVLQEPRIKSLLAMIQTGREVPLKPNIRNIRTLFNPLPINCY